MGYSKSMGEEVPEATARVAKKAFRKGNVYMRMRDEMGPMYRTADFQAMFSHLGQPAESAGILAMVTVMQYAEGLSDRQAADAVRSRIDWKYALGKDLTDEGFDHSVLTEFRGRLIGEGAEMRLLNNMLEQFNKAGLLAGRGTQRTDSTHILAGVRELNRLEMVGETLRHALEVLAVANEGWLVSQLPADWFDRYGDRFTDYRLPKEQGKREALALTIGQDGYALLDVLFEDPQAPKGIAAVETLRQVWIQQFRLDAEGVVRWRTAEEIPPAEVLIQSPFDVTAHFSHKRSTRWIGYKVHLTETCGPGGPHLITHVETTAATTPDVTVIQPIHQALQANDRLPEKHLVDQGYVDAGNLLSAQSEFGVDLIGRAPQDTSWQARTPDAFSLDQFTIDWSAHKVTCPHGQTSHTWSESHDSFDNPVIHVRFSPDDCGPCPMQHLCTRSARSARNLKLRPQPEHVILQHTRQRQTTQPFRDIYRTRSGIEGTISLAVRSFDLRQTRYLGIQKTHLHNILSASALNFTRVARWLAGLPLASTRTSHLKTLNPTLCT